MLLLQLRRQSVFSVGGGGGARQQIDRLICGHNHAVTSLFPSSSFEGDKQKIHSKEVAYLKVSSCERGCGVKDQANVHSNLTRFEGLYTSNTCGSNIIAAYLRFVACRGSARHRHTYIFVWQEHEVARKGPR